MVISFNMAKHKKGFPYEVFSLNDTASDILIYETYKI